MATRERASRAGRSRAGDDLPLGTDKLYFKIGEVAEIVGVATHVLRYWETEFPALRPRKSRTQQRVYRRLDVATLLRIKHLLYVDRFTIEGARKQLRQAGEGSPMAPPAPGYAARQSISRVRAALDDLDALLGSAAELDPAGADPADYLRRASAPEAEPPGSSRRALAERPARAPQPSPGGRGER